TEAVDRATDAHGRLLTFNEHPHLGTDSRLLLRELVRPVLAFRATDEWSLQTSLYCRVWAQLLSTMPGHIALLFDSDKRETYTLVSQLLLQFATFTSDHGAQYPTDLLRVCQSLVRVSAEKQPAHHYSVDGSLQLVSPTSTALLQQVFEPVF